MASVLWENTEKRCYWYSDSNLYYAKVYNNVNYTIFNERTWIFNHNISWIYPKTDLKSIETNYKVTKLNPDAKLYFDPGSGFPRYKLGLTTQKRCIKTTKADNIVVSGSTHYEYTSDKYVVIEDEDKIFLVKEQEFIDKYNGNLNKFSSALQPYFYFINPKVIYNGILYGYSKDSLYLAKYASGEYNLNYITDNDLDKIINDLCPEPTYEEIESIVDMLNSEDAATVQLGVKMIQGYNANKYRLTLRLILCTRENWFLFTKNTVGTKQLIETLNLDRYQIRDSFANGAYYVCYDEPKDITYEAEDIAIAKRLSTKLLTEYFQHVYKTQFIDREYKWLPDERKINLY